MNGLQRSLGAEVAALGASPILGQSLLLAFDGLAVATNEPAGGIVKDALHVFAEGCGAVLQHEHGSPWRVADICEHSGDEKASVCFVEVVKASGVFVTKSGLGSPLETAGREEVERAQLDDSGGGPVLADGDEVVVPHVVYLINGAGIESDAGAEDLGKQGVGLRGDAGTDGVEAGLVGFLADDLVEVAVGPADGRFGVAWQVFVAGNAGAVSPLGAELAEGGAVVALLLLD